ncbi:MAG: hypothetical protein DRH03_12380 [Deltaproteobacteria bacterium]|nr:MAG: hypothetical protein DRH03_12380 [Deltaproteobacteria bacterium]
MALFFPKEYNATRYQTLYRSLSPVSRQMIQREFIGVSYLRRFYLLKEQQAAAKFKNEQINAGDFIHRKLTINRLTWLHKDNVRTHLKIIFRHYLFGCLVQFVKRKNEIRLPEASPACYWETPANLVVLRWLNRNPELWQSELDKFTEQVISESIRHHFIYLLLSFTLAQKIYNRSAMQVEADLIKDSTRPGKIPLGIEMEFSNLGRKAVNKDNPKSLILSDPFLNMELYSNFQLEDVTWRLGGYVDTHEHGRRLLTLSRYGGFFEYSMVRVDYPRTYTLPLTTDPAIADQMIFESIKFIKEIRPHSLHINIEQQFQGTIEPELNDFLCLLLLGGDLGYDDKGQFKEKRFAEREFHRFIKRRLHLNLLSGTKKEVIEYAFLRLKKRTEQNCDYQMIIMALKGFQNIYKIARNCNHQIPKMLAWAENPFPLPDTARLAFVKNVAAGLARETVYDRKLIDAFSRHLTETLFQIQKIIPQ